MANDKMNQCSYENQNEFMIASRYEGRGRERERSKKNSIFELYWF